MDSLFFAGQPIVYPNIRNITAVYGQPLTISTEFCSNPIYNRALWIVRDKVFKPGDSNDNMLAYEITVSNLLI